ncbi:MAG: hypothetical protein C4519_24375 [Desulfobacteraceae bacterium]|nr:MAG: hypothetical protein C4519_24375 [Desulfobacteraceae bacterium]
MRVFFRNTIDVYRLASADNKESYGISGQIKAYIAPLSAEDTMLTEGNPAESFKLITTADADIKKTDRITHNDENYTVSGIKTYGFGALARKEAILTKFNS